MKVKKRTVWFLTLFSLVAVISVYYLLEDNKTPNILALFTDDSIADTEILGVNQEVKKIVNSESDLFQEMRLETSNKRSQLREQLDQQIASTDYTPEQKNEAFNKREELINRESSEATLEMLVKSFGYDDALVRIEDEKVAVTVMSDTNDKKQVNEIAHMIMTELDDNVVVTVDIKPFY